MMKQLSLFSLPEREKANLHAKLCFRRFLTAKTDQLCCVKKKKKKKKRTGFA